MKTITFEGGKYEVEDWVSYVAIDWNGEIYGYESKPNLHQGSYYTVNGKVEFIAYESPSFNFSLIEV